MLDFKVKEREGDEIVLDMFDDSHTYVCIWAVSFLLATTCASHLCSFSSGRDDR